MPPLRPSPFQSSQSSSLLLHHFLRQPQQTIHPQTTPIRHATFIPRPRRPYTFTQLVTLSDGSTYLHRTSSPVPVYKSTKDTRNTQLWNPSSQRLMDVESDEAGRLRAFRSRFGRGWDTKRGKEIELDEDGLEIEESVELVDGQQEVEAASEGEEGVEKKADVNDKVEEAEDEEKDNLLDLISSPEFDTGVVLGPKEKKKKRRGGR